MLIRKKLVLAAMVAAGSAALIATAAFASGPARTMKLSKSVKISSRKMAGLGTILVSSSGRTLYVFSPDHGRHVTCGPKLGCDAVWPPEYIAPGGKPVAGPGVKQSWLRSDPDKYAPGKHVVTYRGWPLYLYAGDHKDGTATGQDTKGSGGYWYVITTSGQVIKHKPKGTTTTTTTTSTTSTTPTTTTTGTTPGNGACGTDQDGDGDQNAGGPDDGDGCI